jgi:hypothetical protein
MNFLLQELAVHDQLVHSSQSFSPKLTCLYETPDRESAIWYSKPRATSPIGALKHLKSGWLRPIKAG